MEERKQLLEDWKREQSLLNTVWVYRLYPDVSGLTDDDALAAIWELVDKLATLAQSIEAATRHE